MTEEQKPEEQNEKFAEKMQRHHILLGNAVTINKTIDEMVALNNMTVGETSGMMVAVVATLAGRMEEPENMLHYMIHNLDEIMHHILVEKAVKKRMEKDGAKRQEERNGDEVARCEK